MKSTANLRVTFWGVQGTCPIYPTPAEIAEFSRQIANSTAENVLLDVAGRLERGECTPAVLRQMTSPQQIAEYQRNLQIPDIAVYGGDTTCVEVLTGDGDTLLFDMGSGMRTFSRHATADWHLRRRRDLHVFASHEHLDHRNGLPFSSICFEAADPFTIHVHGTSQFLRALDDHYGVFSRTMTPEMHVDDPLDYRMIAAKFTATELQDGRSEPLTFERSIHPVEQPIHVGNTSITPFAVYHGGTHCLAYKVCHDKSTFVFCTDHELRHGDDPTDERQIRSLDAERRLIAHCRNADLAYFDGQYLLAEYRGEKGIGANPGMSRLDWGHSCIEDVMERVSQCNIRLTLVGHHDPERPWGNRLELDRQLKELSRGKPSQMQLAKCGDVVEI